MNKNVKAVLFDIDWVIITNVYEFYNHMCKYYLNDKQDMQDFFVKWTFWKTSIWKKDLKEIIKPYLKKWNWTLWVDKLLYLWFLIESKVDNKVISIANKIKEKWISISLVSNQEKYRKDFLLNKLGLWTTFNKNYFSCDLWYIKPNTSFFKKIAKDLNLDFNEILLIDDDPKNINSAKKLWMEAILYKNFNSIKNII